MRAIRNILLAITALTAMSSLAMAAGDGGHVSAKALELFGLKFFTNSSLMALIACVLISVYFYKASAKRELIPNGKQNFAEMIIEFLYGQVQNIVGPKVAPAAFPLLATIFLFVLISNYMGLVPGVGTIYLQSDAGEWNPILRPSTADVNMTLAIAMVAMVIWAYLTFKEIGFWGFLVHTFGPKGGLKGFMRYPVAVIFFVVGIIEIVSMIFRPVSLSARLYGNIFAGESLLHTMSGMADKNFGPAARHLFDVLLPLPFYFMELLVGLLQAMVFTLLVAVYIQLTTTHEEHGDDHGHGHDEGHDNHTKAAH